jgi:hypothetical protein
VGSLAAPLAEGKLLKSSEKKPDPVDHCVRDVDPVYIRLGEGEVHWGKRSRWPKERCWGYLRVGYLEDGHFAISCQGEI